MWAGMQAADFTFGPVEKWLDAGVHETSTDRSATVRRLPGKRTRVDLYERHHLRGVGLGGNLLEACADACNDLMRREGAVGG